MRVMLMPGNRPAQTIALRDLSADQIWKQLLSAAGPEKA